MAARLDAENIQPMRQSLHHLVAKAPWSDEVLLEQVRNYVLPTMQKQGPVVAWIVEIALEVLLAAFGSEVELVTVAVFVVRELALNVAAVTLMVTTIFWPTPMEPRLQFT